MSEKKSYFDQAIESLKEKYQELNSQIERLKKIQKDGLDLFRWIFLGDSQRRIYEYHFFLNGILIKTLSLCESFTIELDNQNPYSLNMILRSNYESWACLNYFRKYPDKRERLIWGDKYGKNQEKSKFEAISVMEMLKELDKNTPDWIGVMKDYDEMSNVVHPNRKSHLANIRPKEENNGEYSRILEFGSSCKLDKWSIENYLNAQINLVNQIFISIKDIDGAFSVANGIIKEMPKIKGTG